MIKIKEISYKIFSFHYWLGKKLPIKKGRVFSVMTHDVSETGNIMSLVNYMKTKGDYSFLFYTGKERKSALKGKIMVLFDLLFKKPFQMAKAEFILMDNAFLPMAFFGVREETKVIQLWHGTGSTKKFGQDSNVGRLKELEKRLNQNIDYLIVNSKNQRKQYARAFGIEEDNCVITGLPRTDWLIRLRNDDKKGESLSEIRKKLEIVTGSSLEGKKILLYAPTFRDDELDSQRLHLNVEKFMENLPEDAILFLKLHPFVAKDFKKVGSEKVINLSFYPDLNELMAISSALITDYSSLIFDYIILDKPMFFCADDIRKFSKEGRGFYVDFDKDLPGFLTDEEENLTREVKKSLYEKEAPLFKEKREAFLKQNYDFLDGLSTKRVFETCIKKETQ